MIPLHFDGSTAPWLQIAVIMLATFASEDLTCFAVGALIGANQLDAAIGLSGCFLGIFVGDFGLWLIGRLARLGLLRLSPAGLRLRPALRETLQRWLDDRSAAALIAARFLPGTRLPLYFASGLSGMSPRKFAFWTLIAAMLWTPALVLLAALLGEVIVHPAVSFLGLVWPVVLLTAIVLSIGLRVGLLMCNAVGRGRLAASISRLWRWEFWPTWFFYLPLFPWLAYLSVRYRGVLTWTLANPGIPQGGVVGESKHAILSQLPRESVVPSVLVPPGELSDRVAWVRDAIAADDWKFPLILKPDASQRGAGVRRIRELADAEHYFRAQPAAVVVQPYHPGPFEAGVFYFRIPSEPFGRIFSITDKVFPILVGDGRSTLEELIWRHPRFRMQARTFLTRHDAERGRILTEGERFPLALAGNHCQGTMFRDGAHLITPALERAIDAVARSFPGFYIGRFDLRYTEVEAFKEGRGFAIVELNGVTSESTNIYDPSWSLFAAYRTLFRQWSLLYRIGDANRKRGRPSTSVPELLRLVFAYYRPRRVDLLAD